MQTIGERLEDARKKKGISIREAAEATKVRGDYLQKFESNLFDIGLTEIYVRGFLRSYATFLKLPADRILNDYTALGHGEARPRQPSREVYGRMDVSISSADDRAAQPGVPAAEPVHAKPNFPRSRSNLPATPAIDPALLLKIVQYVGGPILLLLVVWGVVSIFSSKSPAPATTAATHAPATAGGTATVPPAFDNKTVIIARDIVRVQVWAKDPKTGAKTEVLLPATTLLSAGETATFSRNGPAFISATALENIEIDFNGKRYVPSAPPNNLKGSGMIEF